MKEIKDVKDVIMYIKDTCDELLYSDTRDSNLHWYNYGVQDTQKRITDIVKKGVFIKPNQKVENQNRLNILNQLITKLVSGDNLVYDILYEKVEKRRITKLNVYYGIDDEINFKITCDDKFLITDLDIGKTIFLFKKPAKLKLLAMKKAEW